MIGETLGPYRIDAELGTGGMGKVYSCTVAGRAPGLEPGHRVALKIVHPHLLETPGFFKRFLREAEVGKQVQHENVVRTYDADALAHEGVQHNFLVMEYVEGQTLRDLLDELGRVPEELCRHVGREVANGLAAIHDVGVVHRDMKPENVLITEDHAVKVMDLGVAQLQEEVVRLSQTGAFVGSIHYAAPEQFSDAKNIDHRADLHALGLLLYELATGQHPYFDEDYRVVLKRILREEPRRVAEINPQLSPFMEEVIHTLIAKDREKRFAMAEELGQILEEGEKGEWWKERAKALRVETKAPLRRIRIARETALYGRDAELAKLRGLYGAVKEGSGRVLVLEGEAGIGKTRLIDEFVGLLRQEGEDLNFLFGNYPPGGAATAAGAFSTAYREHFGEAALDETLPEYLTVTTSLVPAFAALLLGEATPQGVEPLTKESLQTVFIHATRALAAERPTIVLIDDLHFAPLDGRALFAALASAVAGHPILLIGSTRPGLEEDWLAEVQRLEHSAHMAVHRIRPKDVLSLLQEALRSRRLAEELGLQIVVKSDGNPFFAFEIIRGLREGEFITQSEDGTWVSTQVIDQIKIPSSVLDLIHARIADLDDEEKDLVDMAACCGFEFDAGLVGDALGIPRIPTLKKFARIESKHRLVRCVGERFVFDHNQVQDALYSALPPPLAREYHAALGDALESREAAAGRDPKELDGGIAVELCDHFLKGHRGAKGVRYLDAALDHLEQGYLHDAAVELADRALSLPGTLDGETRMEMLLRKARRLDVVGRVSEQKEALDEALAIADGFGDPAAAARVRTSVGAALHSAGRFEEERSILAEAEALAVEAGDRGTQAQVEVQMSSLYSVAGRFEEARRHAERALAIATEIGSEEQADSANARLTSNAHLVGQFEVAMARYEERLATDRERGKRTPLSVLGNLGDTLWHLLRCNEASRRFGEVISIARETGNRRQESTATSNLGGLYVTLGAIPRARELLGQALALFREIDNPAWAAYAAHELGAAAECAQELDEAERLYTEALEARRELRVESEVAETLISLGRLLVNTDRPGDARRAFEEALSISRELDQAFTEVLASAYLGLLPDGDEQAALETYARYETRIAPRFDVEARFVLWKAAGDGAHLEAAYDRLIFLRDHAPEEYRDSVMENVPLHRDIVAAWKEHGG